MTASERKTTVTPAGGAPEDLPGLQPVEACDPVPESTGESTGRITRFPGAKHYGFIARFGEPEVFFHVADLADPEIPVETGQRVRFTLIPDHRRPGASKAVNIHRI